MTFHTSFLRRCVPSVFLVAATAALGQTIIPIPSPGNTGAAPNGIAVTPGELLVTQPYCAGMQKRGVYSVDIAGSASALVSTIPDYGVCSENYVAISPGLGGFTAGDTYATGVSPSTSTSPPHSNEAVYKNGSATPFIDNLPASSHHAGITFDTAGTFGNDLIVTLEGSVQGYNSSGTLQFTYAAPAGYVLEGATVAPLTYGACPGCLYVTGELFPNPSSLPGAMFLVRPGTISGTALTFVHMSPGPEPEGLVFVGSACALDGYQYFVSGYATGSDIFNGQATTGAVLAFSSSQLAPYVGKFLVPDEGSPGKPGVISVFDGSTFPGTFSNTAYQLEGSTILSCLGNGCPATFGFWKHNPFPASMFVSGKTSIGCHLYSASDLLAILNSNNAGGNAVTILGHQLIAAIANYDAGGKQTAAASAAIGAAISLLCSNNINMSTDFVSSGSALGAQLTALANTLDTYNSSAPSCEGNGLSTGN